MKITIVSKKQPVRKPQNFCPWLSDETSGGPDKR